MKIMKLTQERQQICHSWQWKLLFKEAASILSYILVDRSMQREKRVPDWVLTEVYVKQELKSLVNEDNWVVHNVVMFLVISLP